ncbi:hypothetical protein G7Y89_g6717 [Cudoniella acicularis]|uniref:Uncharacterized protein n=1 Tax=Cudoniella acicularis TaxID=354080 RepID=A0A8H4RM82_9HELO|nr:hypothetical protein G7Y89_g6717 [Cudoniella acicularis]
MQLSCRPAADQHILRSDLFPTQPPPFEVYKVHSMTRDENKHKSSFYLFLRRIKRAYIGQFPSLSKVVKVTLVFCSILDLEYFLFTASQEDRDKVRFLAVHKEYLPIDTTNTTNPITEYEVSICLMDIAIKLPSIQEVSLLVAGEPDEEILEQLDYEAKNHYESAPNQA